MGLSKYLERLDTIRETLPLIPFSLFVVMASWSFPSWHRLITRKLVKQVRGMFLQFVIRERL